MRWLTRKTASVPLGVQIIEFETGDQLIVESERRVPRDVFERLRAQLNERSDDNVIILEPGLKLVGRRKKEAT